MTTKQDDYIKTAIRLPRELHAEMLDVARKTGKSLNTTMIEQMSEGGIHSEMEYTRITLRIPKKLDTLLNYAAEQSSKSKNAEIISRLNQTFDQKQKVTYAPITIALPQDIVEKLGADGIEDLVMGALVPGEPA
ncbi:MAG: Arc family DNA-binding protein [Pseudomonadota bacterium]